MKTITCYLDFISPYAYLAFEALPKSLMGVSHRMVYKPVLFAGMLKHHGQLGPAEIVGKREWTYRQVLWQAKQLGVAMDMPQSHPFNPLALLRLATACDVGGAPNRFACEKIFRHVWCSGQDATDAQGLAALTADLQPQADVASDAVKQQLKANTDEAIALNLFGVPSFVVDGQVFWGNDALPMLRACLQGDPWFQSPDWTGVAQLPVGVQRKA